MWLLVFSVIGAVFALLSLRSSAIQLIANGLIICYLDMPQVNAAFGRS